MFDFDSSPLFVFVPFISFSILFLIIVLIKSCIVMSRNEMSGSRTRQRQNMPRGRRVGACGGRVATATQSVASIEIQTSPRIQPQSLAQNNTNNNNFVNPPSYYADVLSIDETVMYSMYVPSYSDVASPSIRDPRRFQGLQGLAAPPPYPPPPSYCQIQHFPELPTVSNARLDNGTPSRNGKKVADSIPPVE